MSLHPFTYEQTIAAFWAKVDKTETCWNWTRRKDKDGYGTLSYQQKKVRAHRFIYEQTFGEFDKSLHVLHKCDNPSCVRPDHLFLGNDQDNATDRANKKRGGVGERNRNASMTESQVIEIRRLAASGRSCLSIAREFDLGESQVTFAVNRRTWKHLP